MKAFLIGYSALLVILEAIGDSTNQVEGLLMWINDRNVSGGPEAYLFAHFSGWVNVLGSTAIVLGNFMGDSLLVCSSQRSSSVHDLQLTLVI